MLNIVFGIILFFEVMQYFIIADIFLSWLMLAGIRFRPRFLASILDPLYELVRKYIPTQFGPFDFTALMLIFLFAFFSGLLVLFFPGVKIFFL